ncbi:hypothetical protein TNCV_3676521 [Trichonephila clavipes]|nr:hypothetical protein TNCV_3676521 [Trichonephila clavipes]
MNIYNSIKYFKSFLLKAVHGTHFVSETTESLAHSDSLSVGKYEKHNNDSTSNPSPYIITFGCQQCYRLQRIR